MTPDQFRDWLAAMQASGRISRKAWQADAAALLGASVAAVRNYARIGCNRTVALACAALLAGLG